MKLKILFSIFLGAFILSLMAQDLSVKPDFQKKFRHLNRQDGLSNERILDVIQDRYGFIWIATEEGLNRYDGYEVLVYQHQEEDSVSLSANLITSLAEDIYGNLWVGTIFGLNKFDREKQAFRHYFTEDGLKHNHIRALLADEKGVLWIETLDGHLHQLNIRSNRIEAFKHMGTTQHYYHYHSILKQNDTSIWVGGRNQDVQKFNPKTNTFSYYRYSNSFDFGKRVNDVAHYFEDSQGQMWVCGLDGAYKFDPQNATFELFLSGSTFYIFEDNYQNLWFGTGNGIFIYNRSTNSFSHIVADVNNPHSLSDRNINKILQDRSGVIWVATNNGLNYYSPQLHQFSHYYHIPESENSISGREVTALLEEGDYLWIGTKEKGLNRLNQKTGEIEKWNSQTSPKLLSNRVSDLVMDQNNKLWIAYWAGKGFEKLDIAKNQTQSFRIDSKSTNYDWYHQMLESKNNDLLLAVWGGYGLYQLNQRTEKLENLGAEMLIEPNEPPVCCLNIENDSIWWLGGMNGKLRFYIPKRQQFFTASRLFNGQKPGFQEMKKMNEYHYVQADIPWFEEIEKIVVEKDSSFFIDNHLVLFYDHSSGDFGELQNTSKLKKLAHHHNSQHQAYLDQALLKTLEYEEEVYGINQNQLLKLDSTQQEWQTIDLNLHPQIDLSQLVFHDFAINNESLLIATNKGLLSYHLNRDAGHFNRSRDQHFMHYPVHLLTAISEGNQNDYWLGTTSTGMARWFPEEGKIKNYLSDEFDSTAFWGWDVSFVFKDSKNRIWAGGNGLHLYQEEIDGFRHFTMRNGLASNRVLGMTEDQKGRLWITTNKGLSCFYTDEESFVNYNEASGLPDQKMTRAIINLKDGRIAAALTNGFVVFHPDSLQPNYYIPPVLLSRFQVINGLEFNDLAVVDSIILEPNEHHIAFSFVSLDYNSPENNQYQYKLKGIDDKWLKTDAKGRWINYSNLKPGHYELQLRGSNNNDIWNNNGKSLYLYLKPHFYEQWWFYMLIGIFVIFVIVMIIIYRIRELKLQSKSVQLEQRFLRSQMNPHFIFNSLGAIQNYIFKNEPLEAASYLSDFSNLVRKILQNSREDLITLEEEVETLRKYLELQKLRFQEKFDYVLEVDEQLSEKEYKIPPMLAQPFIENSIEHAFKGIDRQGMIKICFKKEEGRIRLICQDNGIGIKAASAHKKMISRKHQSLATQITRDRIKILSKLYKTKIGLQVQDLSELDSSKNGTQVIIEIPLYLKKTKS